MNTLLRVQGLSVRYRTLEGFVSAVDNVSFSIDRGIRVGIVGESGCGKTTISKAILRILPTNADVLAGKIFFEGKDIMEMTSEEIRKIRWRNISLIPQSSFNALNPVFRIRKQISEVISETNTEDKIEELFEFVGLDVKRLRDYPHELSGGQKQRVMIAMSLTMNPKLVIADEPTTGLDVILRNINLRKLIEFSRKLDTSIMFITHDLSQAFNVCDEIHVMYAGQIVETATTEKILNVPAHPYTIGLINAYKSLLEEGKQLASIPGYPPIVTDSIKGCRFIDRCPFADKNCIQEPKMKTLGRFHFVKCHYVEKSSEFREASQQESCWGKIENKER